jgi:hypothetical protein
MLKKSFIIVFALFTLLAAEKAEAQKTAETTELRTLIVFFDGLYYSRSYA